jgi:hypothetical protein
MTSLLLGVGILVETSVTYDIGGSTTGPAFDPTVGANAISKSVVAGLMRMFFLPCEPLVHDPVSTVNRTPTVDHHRRCHSVELYV